jgi:hypothetical protein
MTIPTMTNAEAESFERQVLALFRAGWNTEKIRSWAIGAGSGFARFWRSVEQAQDEVNAICRAENRRIAAENRKVTSAVKAALRADPLICDLARTLKIRI